MWSNTTSFSRHYKHFFLIFPNCCVFVQKSVFNRLFLVSPKRPVRQPVRCGLDNYFLVQVNPCETPSLCFILVSLVSLSLQKSFALTCSGIQSEGNHNLHRRPVPGDHHVPTTAVQRHESFDSSQHVSWTKLELFLVLWGFWAANVSRFISLFQWSPKGWSPADLSCLPGSSHLKSNDGLLTGLCCWWVHWTVWDASRTDAGL